MHGVPPTARPPLSSGTIIMAVPSGRISMALTMAVSSMLNLTMRFLLDEATNVLCVHASFQG